MTASDPVTTQISQWQRNALLVGIAGTLVAIVGFLLDRDQFLRSYLFGFLYWMGMGLGCMGILMMHHTVGGKWGMVIRRMCEAGASVVPFMILLLIPVFLNLSRIYPWARADASHDASIQAKAAYLNPASVIGRAIFYFLVWALYAYLLTRWSAEQDRTGDPRLISLLISKMRAISAPGLVVFTFIGTFAYVDWIMSLEPHWFSTVYGVMLLVGQVLEAFAFTIALLIILSRRSPLKEYVTPQHLHDLGNLMFAFMVLWAYLSFSQFLIIWSGNLPDETSWYLNRIRGGWGWVALILVIFHFAAPFVILLMRKVKRNADRLFKVCILMLLVRVVADYWIVEPSFYNQHISMHWMDLVMLIAIGGLWLAAFFWQLNSRPLVPLKDPRLAGAPRETVAF